MLSRFYCGFIVVFWLSILGQSAYAQNDSLKQVLAKLPARDTTYVLVLCDYAYSFDDKNYDSLLSLAKSALTLSNKLSYARGKAGAFWLKGLAFYYLDQVDSSQKNLELGLPFALQSRAGREQGRIYNTLANVARYRGNQSKALDHYFKSLRIKQTIGDGLGAAITLNNIANVYSEKKDWSRALPYYQQSLQIRRRLNREHDATMLLSTLGENHLQLGDVDSAYYYLNRALQYSIKSNDAWSFVHTYYGLTNFHLAQHNSDSSLFYCNKGLLAARIARSKDREVLFLNKKSELLNLKQRYSLALAVADSAQRMSTALKRLEYLVQSEKNLSDAYAGLKRYAEAYARYQQYKMLSDSTQSKAFHESLRASELEFNLETEKIRAENERFAFQQKEKERLAILWIVAGVAITVTGIALMFYKNLKYRTQSNQELEKNQQIIQQQNNEIQAQNEELQLQQEEITATNEKLEQMVNKRTQELHETVRLLTEQNAGLEQFSYIVSHNLRAPLARISGIVNLMKMAEFKQEEIEKLVPLLHQTTQTFEEVIRDLSLIINLKKGIDFSREWISLKHFVESLLALLEPDIQAAKATVLVHVDEQAQLFAVKSFLHSILFNLIQNALKYKAPERSLQLSVDIKQEGGVWHFTIQDNGLGIDLNERNTQRLFGLYNRFHPTIEGKGFGLYLVKTQVELMGGTISARSTPNVGSTFTVVLPKSVEA